VSDENQKWSPDGSRLVFERWVQSTGAVGRSGDLFVVRADGAGLQRLTATGTSYDPAWSPDGRSIAFVSADRLFLMGDDGSRMRALTKAPAEAQGVLWPSWSPDGKRIAFTTRSGAVFVVDNDGTGKRPLTGAHSGGYCPAWSPDGRRVAFVHMPDRYASIYAVDAHRRGARVRRVTRHAYTESGFVWSPDSRRIVYARERQGGVYTINVDGTHDRRLTRDPLRPDLWAGGFSWSPDRQEIAYGSDRSGNGDIYVMDLPLGGRQQLTDGLGVDGAPRWSLSPRTESC